ncbi:hypothetical protein B0T19DRAFT_274100 [Cercophora scortea]|uniref:Polynucleotide 5'-hydroxyl-kinase GRC3 n=1 Tax=Cercophora scortea TaxID=314031 RepID=A0AAE0M618_9PEZI|nr:hypothetical protein B0T19DRAFT_274100 [Cercophora scortea]
MAGAVFFASDKIHWVHAPYCHALPVIRATASNTVIELHPHPAARGLRQLAKLNPAFGKLWNESIDKIDSTFEIMYTSEDAPKKAILQQLVSPAEWNKKLAGIIASKQKRTPIIFVCGPKSSGKSTFGRLLANRLVTDQNDSGRKPWSSVLVLDLDPGQPEYGPPGVISLNKISVPTLSPPFCHPTLDPTHSQLRAHAIASVSPALDPEHFVECALDLLSTYRRSINAKHPLVINTPGWIQGTGLDLLAEMVKEMRPTEVIYMSQDGPDETVDSLKSACGTSVPFTTLPSQPSENTPRTALHLRTMQTMSYFHLDWASLAGAYQTWNPTPLTELRPWRVRYSGGADRGFIGILFYDHQPAPDLITEAVNGMILALVRVESKAAFRDLINQDSPDSAYAEGPQPEGGDPAGSGSSPSRNSITRSTEGIPLIQNPQGRTLSPRHSRMLGLVLVRGVDTARGELQLLTPLPAEVLIEAGGELVLVAGKFDTPSWAYAEELHRKAAGGAAVVVPIEEDEVDGQVVEEESGSGSDEEEGEEEEEEEEEEEQESRRDVGKTVEASQTEMEIPWAEMLHGNQKRSVGSRVWRVRRDLGRN